MELSPLTNEELEELFLLNLAEKFRSAKATLESGGPLDVAKITLSPKELGVAINGLRALREEAPQSPEDLSAKILSERRDMLRRLRPATLRASES